MKAFDDEPGTLVHRGTVLVPKIVKKVLQSHRIARWRAYDEMIEVGNRAAIRCAQTYGPPASKYFKKEPACASYESLERAGSYENYVTIAISQQVRATALKFL